MTSNYIQIGKDFRLTKIGGPGTNLYQIWKVVSGGGYRKAHLQISILNKINFIKTQYILHMVIKQFVDKKLSTRGYIVSPGSFREFNDITTDGILSIAKELSSDEVITIFYKTK